MDLQNLDIDALISRAREHVAKPKTSSVEVIIGDELHELAFTRLDGMVWASIKATHPPRPGSRFDANLGYNVDAAPRDYPVEAIRLSGQALSDDQWKAIFATLHGPSIRDVATTVWGLNDFEVAQRAGELKKASAGVSEKKSNSPAN